MGDVSAYMLDTIKYSHYMSNENHQNVKLLLQFYPDKIMTTCKYGNGTVKYAQIRKLVQRKYLQRIGNSHPFQYRLTLCGKCRILCSKLGVSILGFCILTEAYATYRYQVKNHLEPSYVLQGVDDLLGGLYTMQTILNTTTHLYNVGLADKTQDNAIRLREETVALLSQFSDVLDEMHEWIVGVPYQLDMLALGNGQTDQKAAL